MNNLRQNSFEVTLDEFVKPVVMIIFYLILCYEQIPEILMDPVISEVFFSFCFVLFCFESW